MDRRRERLGLIDMGWGEEGGCGMKIGHLNAVRGGGGGTDEMWV